MHNPDLVPSVGVLFPRSSRNQADILQTPGDRPEPVSDAGTSNSSELLQNLLMAAADVSATDLVDEVPLDARGHPELVRQTLWNALSEAGGAIAPKTMYAEDLLRNLYVGCAEASGVIEDEIVPTPSAEQIREALTGAHEDLSERAIYRGGQVLEEIPAPQISSGEILIRVEACGICHSDLKKIEYNLLAPPRIYGHETAGVVAAVGGNVTRFMPGDRVVAFHHVPCGVCFYCQRKLFSQCATYKKVGITAGFEPAGGGFAQYVRVMDWIAESGVERIPDGVSFERATLVEPLNTCLNAVVQCDPKPGDFVVVFGQGPIGLMFTMLVDRTGARVAATDTIGARLSRSSRCGADFTWDPSTIDVSAEAKRHTEGRGADLVIVATSLPGIVDRAISCSRPGARILLFAQTSATERIDAAGADVCVGERTIFGSYGASIDLQKESARLVFSGELPLEELDVDSLPTAKIRSGIDLALHPGPKSLKIIVQPQRWSRVDDATNVVKAKGSGAPGANSQEE